MNYLPQKMPPQFSNYPLPLQPHLNRSRPQPPRQVTEMKVQQSYQLPQQLGYSKITSLDASESSSRIPQTPNNDNKPMNFDSRMYLLMKEQIEISAANYRQKIGSQLRSQAQQIQRLNCQLINNAHIISKQAQFIKRLTEKGNNLSSTRLDMSSFESSRAASKSPGKLSLTQKKIVDKPKLSPSPIKDPKAQIEPKIQFLGRRIEEINSQMQQTAIKSRQLYGKITDLQKNVSNNMWKKLDELKERLGSFCRFNEEKIVKLCSIIDNKPSQKRQLASHMAFLRQETEQIKQLIVNISSRQYAYDSYPLNVLKQQLKKLTKRLEDMSKSSKDTVSITQAQTFHNQKSTKMLNHSLSLQYSQRLNETISFQQGNLNRSQLSSLTHYAPKYIKAVEDDRVKRSNKWESQQCDSSFSQDEQDGFFYPETVSQLHQNQERIQRLTRIVRRECARLPVKVEIDQTGYIKYSKTGMYILDENGDGFELTSNQIHCLQMKEIIHF